MHLAGDIHFYMRHSLMPPEGAREAARNSSNGSESGEDAGREVSGEWWRMSHQKQA